MEIWTKDILFLGVKLQIGLNHLLEYIFIKKLNINKIDDLGDGLVYLKIFEITYPKILNLSKIIKKPNK